jgi:hypothetical protein
VDYQQCGNAGQFHLTSFADSAVETKPPDWENRELTLILLLVGVQLAGPDAPLPSQNVKDHNHAA